MSVVLFSLFVLDFLDFVLVVKVMMLMFSGLDEVLFCLLELLDERHLGT